VASDQTTSRRSALARAALTRYQAFYSALVGTHPHVRRGHFQWLSGNWVYPDLRRALEAAGGRVLDVGCAGKPYAGWAPRATEWYGIDVYDGPEVDAVFETGESWPVADASVDTVLCAAVLVHVADLDQFVAEVERVLVPGGRLVATAAFMHNEVKMTDYWRISRPGMIRLFGERLELQEVTTRGAIGSVLGVMALNWMESSVVATKTSYALGILLLPVRILIAAVINTVAPLVDRADRTGAFYGTVFVLAEKPAAAR
jgi:SAM-dependent methyltransferase